MCSEPTAWSRVLLDNQVISQLLGNSDFMEFDGSLPHSPKPATCLCPDPEQSNSHPISLTCILILSSHLLPGFPVVPYFPTSPQIPEVFSVF
jgi:hypothetical protein